MNENKKSNRNGTGSIGFKNDVSDGWLFKQELRFMRNFIRNWDSEVEDDDFFDPFGNCNNSDNDEAASMLAKYFSPKELEDCRDLCVEKDPGEGKAAAPVISIDMHSEVTDALQWVWNHKSLRSRCRAMLLEWCDAMERRKTQARRRKDPMELRANEIFRLLGLDEVERDLFLYAAVRALTCFDDFPRCCTRGRHDSQIFFAMAVDRPCGVVGKALAADGRLRKGEALGDDGELERHGAFYEFLESGDGGVLEGRFYRKAETDDALPWKYYGRLAEEHGGLLKKLISSSARDGRGANILFYGAAGTGKTSFAKTLAKELDFDLFEIRQGPKDGDRHTSVGRLFGIRICNDQAPKGHSMVLVDEADRLLRTSLDFFASRFGGMGGPHSEKGAVNTMLDETKLPTIWISNTPAEALDDSVRRRFDYSIRFDKLNAAQRQAIWRNGVAKFRLGKIISEEDIVRLADKYQTNAGGISLVLENVRRLRPKKNAALSLIDKLMKPHCELMGAEEADSALLPSRDYSLDGLNLRGDVSLDRIVEAVRRFRAEKDCSSDPDRPRMNLLLWGPPGTGKTEFVKYLGQALDAKVLVKMGGDLLSMWVGGTEQNIKEAFNEAEDEDAILFLDEIDGLVQDRSGAQQSWEVTQVNELLHRMENFKGVMVGATNFNANLDAAIMRRFTFKLQFDYLTDDGKRLFFERMFKSGLSDAEARRLASIPRLAPGDFRTVRQSLHYLGGDVTNAMRLDGLEKESLLKKDSSRPIGFR